MPYDTVRGTGPAAVDVLADECERQNDMLAMIASENHVSGAAMEAQGSELMNSYAEDYPESRYYDGCEYADEVEQLAVDRAKEFWGTEHINVQSHLGPQANTGMFLAVLDPSNKILSLDLTHGGHLSHNHPMNVAGKAYEVEQYEVNAETGYVDYDRLTAKAETFDPDIIISGYSMYPREVEWECVQAAADSADVYHLADITRITGLVTTGEHSSPAGTADFVTGSAHKTIRLGRGGITMCDEEHADDVDSAVFPGLQGGPILRSVADRAVGFGEVLAPKFEEYASQVVDNVAALGKRLWERSLEPVPKGADTYLVLVDLRSSHPDTTGKDMEAALEEIGIVLNANMVPGKSRSAFNPSGIHAGTPALTTHGSDEGVCRTVADLIYEIVDAPYDESVEGFIDQKVDELAIEYPLYD